MASGTQGPASLLGQVIGGYRLERVLGKGATGAVFLGQWAATGERPRVERVGDVPIELPDTAAVKVLILPWQLDDAERNDFRARFLREAETQQRLLRHPHIVTVLAYGEDAASGLTYMVQPYLRGGTLADKLAARTAPIPFAETASLLQQLADGLDYAHRQGVIHRDIKPANVLLDEQGQASLSDFSIVRLLADTQTKLTTTGRVMGTPQYMAPEQVAGGEVGPEADLYSLGMVAYELVTGRPAFEGPSLVDMIRQQAQETPPAPRTLRPDLPEPAEDVLLKALAKVPTDRFATATAFAEAFEQGIQGQRAAGVARISSGGVAGIVGGAALPGVTASVQRTSSPQSESPAPAPYYAPTVPTVGGYTPTMVAGGGRPNRRKRGWLVPLVAAVVLVAVTGVAVFARDAIFGPVGPTIASATNTAATGFATDTAYPTATDTATATEIVTATATNTAVPTPIPPTSVPYFDCGSYVDLGNAQSEMGHNVAGWAGTYLNQPPSPSGDTSFRYQPRGSKAAVKLCVSQAGVGYTLTTEVQDFGCDDSFEIFVNSDSAPIYQFTGTRSNVVRVHNVSIPASEVSSRDVVLGFESTTSDCGYAGVYNVGLS